MNYMIDEQRIKDLERHSQMLGIIGAHVEEWCKSEEDTTLTAVLRLISEYYSLRYELSLIDLEKSKK